MTITWQSQLEKAGYPTTVLVLDFETYFDKDYTLKKMSTVEYVCDKRFEIIGLGAENSGEWEPIFLLPDEIEDFLTDIDWDRLTIVGQNLKFDCSILARHFDIIPQYTVDLIDLDRIWDARDRHNLKYMAKKWKAPKSKGNIDLFKGLRWADMDTVKRQKLMDTTKRQELMDTVKRMQELEEYTKGDVEIESFLFQKLMPLIPNPHIELPLATQTLHLYLKPQIEIDTDLGHKLIDDMRGEMIKCLRAVNQAGVTCPKCKDMSPNTFIDKTTELIEIEEKCSRCNGFGTVMDIGLKEISGNISFLELLNATLPEDERVPMKMGKNKMIPALAREDEGMRHLLNHKSERVRLLAEARLAIKSWPLHIKRVQNLMDQAACSSGKIGAPLSYHTAHTGRWGGTEGLNLQNLGGRGRGKPVHSLISQIRHMLKAPDNSVFAIGDYAQIEARILAWLAGQDDLVQMFANGSSPYSDLASEIFQCEVRKPKDTDSPDVYKRLAVQYGFGKDGILGCGYGLGTNKFYARCRENETLRPLFDNGKYGWDFVDRVIKTYRTKYAKIPKFWRTVEKAWRFVTKYPKEKIAVPLWIYNPVIPNDPWNPLWFWHEDKATFIGLPSGRFVRYPYASVNKQGDLLYRWGKLWGGSITENIVQAVARDILAEALLRLQNAGYNVLLTVHDEIICLFNKSNADLWLVGMERLMVHQPFWAFDLPTAVETKLVERYEK